MCTGRRALDGTTSWQSSACQVAQASAALPHLLLTVAPVQVEQYNQERPEQAVNVVQGPVPEPGEVGGLGGTGPPMHSSAGPARRRAQHALVSAASSAPLRQRNA